MKISNNPKDKELKGSKRSDKWPGVRRKFLKKHPTCMFCGGKKKLEVHHIEPFHISPEKELDENNLITLCENDADGVNCHLLCGHLGNFKSINRFVRTDSRIWNKKISLRPHLNGQRPRKRG